jgi:hypothetical protein
MLYDIRARLIQPPVRIEAVDLDGTGTTVYLRQISEFDWSQFEAAMFDSDGKVIPAQFESQRRRLLVMTLCDANGSLLFKPTESALLNSMHSDEAAFLYDEYKRLFPRSKRPAIKSLEKKLDATLGYE